MSRVDVGGLTTHCRQLGPVDENAPVVVFVHGLGTDSLASFHLTLASPVAGAGHRVISYDLRGHGRSAAPPTGYTLEQFVDDLEGLLDVLDVRRPVHLVGNSFGGTVAFAFAAAHPERVAGLVAIEAEPPTEVWRGRMADVLGRTRDWFLDANNFEWVGRNYSPHYERLARAAALRVLATDMVDAIPASRLPAQSCWSSLATPVLSIVGSDGYQSDDLGALERLLPRCRTVVMPDQGHSVLVERHREVRDLVLEFLAEHDVAVGEEARSCAS